MAKKSVSTQIQNLAKKYRVATRSKVVLSQWDSDGGDEGVDREEAEAIFRDLRRRLVELQALLFAEKKHKVLMVIQAMDTGGKDSTIRSVFKGVNPQGVHVQGFKVPTEEELAHDYLWRVHQHTPGKGEISVFNRSHYEDVLVVRVHNYVPESQWQKRYRHINEFERLLAEEGTTILKFYLHIDKEEQKQRLQDRLDEPHKRWKFNPGDLEERKLWPKYMKAYQDALSLTSQQWAPWYVIPANRKWYRNLIITKILVDRLEALNMKYPRPSYQLKDIEIR